MAQDETKNPIRNEHPQPNGPPENRAAQLGLGFFFGVIFGFLLQKGGVAKYEVLIGMLLLEDFTVVKVMMSAVVVGMIGIYALHTAGLVKLHIKPTRYGANTLGGILFGIGFGLAAYCPGTGAAALGQGNFDAIAVLLGLMAFGARMADGCTSGHGISGAMQLSVGSWIALLGFFVGGVATAMLLFYA